MFAHMQKLATAIAAGIAATVSVPVCAQAQAQEQQQQQARNVSEDDFLLLQLTLGKYQIGEEIRGYQTQGSVCLDLADVIQALDLPVRLDKKSRRATGWLFAEDQKITIDREANTVQTMNAGSAPLRSEIIDTPEGWCIDVRALSRWFGVPLTPDLYNAAIRVDEKAELPFIAALERKSRAARLRPKTRSFDLSSYPRAEAEYRLWRTPSVDVMLRSDVSAGAGRNRMTMRYEAYAVGELGGASYSARLASDSRMKPRSLRFTAYRDDPDGNLLGPLKATQVAVGDVETLAGQLTGRSAIGRGAFLSSRPLSRSSRYSMTQLRGILPQGWDAELYRNGQLIAFQDSSDDGRYTFEDIALFFGRNDFEVILYGPQGQIRKERTSIPVGRSAVEPGKTHYWAGVVQNGKDLISLGNSASQADGKWRWGVGVEHGLSDRTSFSLEAQSLHVAGRRRRYLEAGLVQGLGSLQMQLGTAWQMGGGAALQASGIGQMGSVNLAADAIWVRGDFASDFVGPETGHKFALRADSSLTLGQMQLPFQLALGHSGLRNGSNVTDWGVGLGATLFGTNLRAELTGPLGEHSATASGTSREIALRILASRRMFGLSLRGGLDFDLTGGDKGLKRARLTTGKALDENSELNAEVEYSADRNLWNMTLGYSRQFNKFALRTNALARSDGSLGANIALAFSFGPDLLNGGVRVSQQKLARTGQALVQVFRDDNGDGVRNPQETGLESVYVEAGLRPTDSITRGDGQALVDGLKPNVPVVVGVDEASLGDPYLVPAVKGVVVVPRAGVTTRVDFPVSPSGEIEGALVSASGVAQSGVELELVDRRGGVIAQTITEFDGFFLFERAAYGQYSVRLAKSSARILQAHPLLVDAVIINREVEIARLGIVRLVDNEKIATMAYVRQQAEDNE
ncbi:MAG: carboxypeptidase-like regulatory domain-containing protein [Sphingomonadaceae bacterium]